MPQQGVIFRALIASPSDCAQERKIIPEVISAWNAVNSLDRAAVVEPVLWETHSRPEVGKPPQELLNRQLLENCDLVIGAFWTRLGTPTGKAESGTAEEIEHFRKAGKPVLLYFSSVPVILDSIDQDQYKALIEYKKLLSASSLYSSYTSLSELRNKLHDHFASLMISLLSDIKASHSRSSISENSESYEKIQQLVQFINQFDSFYRGLVAEWEAERDSDPYSTEDGKYLISRAVDDVVHFKSMITTDNSGISQKLSDILKKMKLLQRHETFLDGGKSFREFWDIGDNILESLKSVGAQLNGMLSEIKA